MKSTAGIGLTLFVVIVGKWLATTAFPHMAEIPYWELAKEGGAVLVVGVGFMMTLQWMLKRQEQRMRAQELALLLVSRSILSLDQRLASLQLQILAHDLTITGLNPSAGADFDERDSRAYQKYKEVSESMRSSINDIEQLKSLIMNISQP